MEMEDELNEMEEEVMETNENNQQNNDSLNSQSIYGRKFNFDAS